jgi:hypothetical protein
MVCFSLVPVADDKAISAGKNFWAGPVTGSFGESEYTSRHWRVPEASLKQASPIGSAMKRRGNGFLSQNLLRLIGSRFGSSPTTGAKTAEQPSGLKLI